jgi:hypothetical protein
MKMSVQYDKISQFTQVPTYEVLQQLVVDFLNRSDAGTIDNVPLFINFAEKAILRNLRIPAMEVMKRFVWGEYALEPGLTEGWIYIPGDYLEMVDIWTEKGIINRTSFSELMKRKTMGGTFSEQGYINENPTTEDTYDGGGCGGDPFSSLAPGADGSYARNANRWYFNPVPKADEEIYLTYYKDPMELSEETGSSDLLVLLPDAILYMSISEGHRFLMEEEKAMYYEGLARERVQAVTDQIQEAEFSGGVPQINLY